MVTREQDYNIFDLNLDTDVFAGQENEDTPSFQNTFTDGVSPNSIGSGDLGGQVTLQEGFLQSSNFVSGSAGWQLTPTSAELNVSTALLSLDIPDTTTANSFHVESDGDTFWGATPANFTSDNDNANAYILKDGTAKFQSVTLANSVVIQDISSGSIPSIQGWQYDGAFSASDHNTVAWASGTLRFDNGETRSITGSNTGNISSRTYIYYDEDASTTAFQTTTTAANAVGKNKIRIAIAENTTSGKDAEFQVFGGIGGFNKLLTNNSITANTITASEIATGTITANEISSNTITASEIAAGAINTSELAANAVTAAKINVTSLSAVSASMGTLTAGKIDVGNIEINADNEQILFGSATAPLTGNGIFMGKDGSDYEWRVGDPNGDFVHYDGSNFSTNKFTFKAVGTYGGDGSDGALSVSSGNTNISLSNAKLTVLNYTSISITGTGSITFTNPHSTGSVVILKSQGSVTLTSSATPMIDASGLGAPGGAGASVGASSSANGTTGTNSAIYSFLPVTNGGEGGKGTTASGGAAGTLAYPTVTASTLISRYPHIFVGAGGGGGAAAAGSGSTADGGAGGRGGGGLVIECADALNFTTTNGISVAGDNGSNASHSGSNYFVGGGGGGAGGFSLVTYNTLTAASGTVNVSGGTGGTGAASGSATVKGGGGGGGNHTVGDDSEDPTVNQTDGGDGADGLSVVEQNTVYA